MTSTSLRHLRHLPRQLPVVASFGRAVITGMRGGGHTLAGAHAEKTIAPIDPRLIRDYVAHVGGDPAAYKTTVPPHLFPQWGLALAARTLTGLRYPLLRVLNAGCRLEINAPLPSGQPLVARASLVAVDDDGQRAALTQRVATGTSEVPDSVVATIRAVVPLAPSSKPRARTEIPYDVRELARWQLGRDAGLAFALLTGDFNPIHWVHRAGVAAGFGGPILHGFAMLARSIEGVVRARFAGDITRVRAWDVRFTRPLRLPAHVALFGRGDEAWLGDAPGGAPYLALAMEPV
ncbi:MAG TPA: MaoC/PaaZ C-terminal domain-containing protein [Kofleriaceae bacterium]